MKRQNPSKPESLALPVNVRIARVLETIALVFALLSALALCLSSLFVSAKIGVAQYSELYVSLVSEKLWLSLLLLAAGLAVLSLLSRVRVTKRFNRWFAAVAFTLLG